MFTVGFYIPLKQIMGALAQGMSSYAQYLMPLIALQAIAFAAVSAAFRSATDSVQGINRRFKAMPIAPLTPLASRMSASMYRCSIALAVSLVCGHVIGFRFYGGVAHTVGFCLLGAADRCGAVVPRRPDRRCDRESGGHHAMMLLPQLILGCCRSACNRSNGSRWIQPFVRNQPVSQFVYALRALAGDSTPAAGSGDLVCHRPDPGLGRGLDNDSIPLHALVASRRR